MMSVLLPLLLSVLLGVVECNSNCHGDAGNSMLAVSHRIAAAKAALQSDLQFPSDLVDCPTAATLTTKCLTGAEYDEISDAVRSTLRSLDSTCTAEVCPQADWAGCVLRMAGHDFMDFKWGEGGGSDGCVDFADVDNQGLQGCLTGRNFVHEGDFANASVLDIYQGFCSRVSLADFFVLAAEAVMAETRPGASSRLKASFRYGRTTSLTCEHAQGRLPDPELGCGATQQVFLEELDMTWEQTAALMGVHTLGRAHKENSGYHGWWSDPNTSRIFNNDYYVSLLSKAWGAKSLGSKNQWDRVDTGAAGHASAGNEMMLNTDLCLAFNDVTAKDAVDHEQCSCMWVMPNGFFDVVTAMPEREWCGSRSLFDHEKIMERSAEEVCCPAGSDTCDDIDRPQGVAIDQVRRFAQDDEAWFEAFVSAWSHATSMGLGHVGGILLPLKQTCTAADIAREIPVATFPLTTTTTTTSTTHTEAFVDAATVERWYLGNSMDSCTQTCQLNGRQCTWQGWQNHGHEVNSYEKMAALVNQLTDLVRSRNNGSYGAYYRTADGKAGGGGTTRTALERWTGDMEHPAGKGSWNEGFRCARDQTPGGSESFMTPAVNFMPSLTNYECRFNKPNRSYHLDQCDRMYVGAGWRRLCVCEAISMTTSTTSTTTVQFPGELIMDGWCANWRHGSSEGQQKFWNNDDMAEAGCFDKCRADFSCMQAVYEASGPWGAECWLGINNMSSPTSNWSRQGAVDRCYAKHGILPSISLQSFVAVGELHSEACMKNGEDDPECCARSFEAACAPGFEYTAGLPCMWTHDHQYFQTECRETGTTLTTTIPIHAEGWFLGPQGDANCSDVCVARGLRCTVAGFEQSLDQVNSYDKVQSIIDTIGQRDWLGGDSNELNYPKCCSNGGSAGYRLWPGFWGRDFSWCNCMYLGDVPVPLDHCDPENPSGGWRRLCKCTE
mmetsp:Transcript_16801/g.29496  ORF Transcript_16801/g.29496 Transcript_16801/m.29496 type:complete len:948 (-) Transcript_16801:335-3178(-)